ncbi:hypothetical protein O164_11380 [Pseudomonas taiwanensis SJ9]|uniref:Uncharacterized protein n=1 Tax=Pseudomonas taiwanensis SJ9 TaxID=1388762 RepID=V7DE88_9PSED|nr:hypothetical protein O164_11380 [Pseudomonas taiwanensis SJ9]
MNTIATMTVKRSTIEMKMMMLIITMVKMT